MFCSNCGKQIEDGAAFCSGCGTSLNSQPQPQAQIQTVEQPVYQQPVQQPIYQQPAQQPSNQNPVSSKKRTAGIAMVVLSAMVFLGWGTNGTYERFAEVGPDLSDIFAILLVLGLMVGGVYLIIKNKKQ